MTHPDSVAEIDAVVARARAAQQEYEQGGSQARYDRAAQAVGWAIMEPARNRALAELAVQTTGLGNVPDKITKNHRKTLGLLRDISTAATYGTIRDDAATGITEIARPMGVIGAIVPSTNPAATPANNIINALKCGNAIVVAPSPKGVASCEQLLAFIHAEFEKIGENPDLVQMVPAPGSKEKTQRLMEVCDKVVATGSQNNVHRACSLKRGASADQPEDIVRSSHVRLSNPNEAPLCPSKDCGTWRSQTRHFAPWRGTSPDPETSEWIRPDTDSCRDPRRSSDPCGGSR